MDTESVKSENIPGYNKILVPVDYSECSKLACKYAIKIASKLNAEIILFHAYYSPAIDLIDLSGVNFANQDLSEDVLRELEAEEMLLMDNFKDEITQLITREKLANITLKHTISNGNPESEIIRYSRSLKPDLVIMGTKGKSKKENTIFGSVTAAIIGKIGFPFLTIPENYKFIGLENINNLMYVTEFDESDFDSIKSLLSLINPFNLRLFCVHLGKEKKGEWTKVKLEGLKSYLKENYSSIEVICDVINNKNLIHELDDYIKANTINIMALTSKKRGLLSKIFKGNLTKTIFYHSNIPLLIFHY